MQVWSSELGKRADTPFVSAIVRLPPIPVMREFMARRAITLTLSFLLCSRMNVVCGCVVLTRLMPCQFSNATVDFGRLSPGTTLSQFLPPSTRSGDSVPAADQPASLLDAVGDNRREVGRAALSSGQ